MKQRFMKFPKEMFCNPRNKKGFQIITFAIVVNLILHCTAHWLYTKQTQIIIKLLHGNITQEQKKNISTI